MDSLQNILGQKDFTPPNEIALIKNYILRRYQSKCYIKAGKDSITIAVHSSSLAGTIHLERQQLIDACGIKNKKLIIRTGTIN